MTYPLVKFTDAISGSVRLDLNDRTAAAPRGVEADFDTGAPALEGDPDAVGQVLGFRSLNFTVQIKGTKANALAFVSALSKELMRQTNWLMFQPSSTQQAVWFKTYRMGFQSLSLEQVFANTTTGGNASAGFPDVWRVDVPLTADPLAYGARQTITTAQVVQGPVDLTSPTRTAMRVVLPTIKGDAPTKLRVKLTPAGPAGTNNNIKANGSQWLVACVAGASTMTDTVVDIGTGDTVINDIGTAAPTTDATYFGGSYRTVTIATPATLVERFTIKPPSTMKQGRYKALLRCKYVTATAKTILFRANYLANAVTYRNGVTASVSFTAQDNNRFFWVDLGEWTFPFGIDPASDASGTMPTLNMGIEIGTSDGTTSAVNVDAMKFIPVDGPTVTRTTLVKSYGPTVGVASGGIAGTFDGDTESWWGNNQSSGTWIEGTPTLTGYLPVADPAAAQNLLIVMALDPGSDSVAGGTNFITDLNAQTAVDVSYFPRYLHIGDGT